MHVSPTGQTATPLWTISGWLNGVGGKTETSSPCALLSQSKQSRSLCLTVTPMHTLKYLQDPQVLAGSAVTGHLDAIQRNLPSPTYLPGLLSTTREEWADSKQGVLVIDIGSPSDRHRRGEGAELSLNLELALSQTQPVDFIM